MKKGFIRTLEAIIAIFITLFFVTFVLPKQSAVPAPSESLNLMDALKEDETLRDCVIIGNTTCINATINRTLEDSYDFAVSIATDPLARATLPSEVHVYSESVMIAGNSTSYSPKILRVYYWARS